MEYCWFVIIMFMFSVFTFVPQTFSQANQYAIMKFVLQWNPTFCMIKQCVNPIPQNFTIHGMWPANVTGHSLEFPKPHPGLVKQDIQQLMNDNILVTDLRHVWPSVVPKFTNEEFWRHEWGKHGYGIKTEVDVITYFKAAARIHDTMIATNGKNNLKDYFLNANIIDQLQLAMGRQVMVTPIDIGNALAQIVRGVYLHCYRYRGKCYLKEVVFCLDKSSLYSFVSCPGTTTAAGRGQATLSSGCVPTTDLYLPA